MWDVPTIFLSNCKPNPVPLDEDLISYKDVYFIHRFKSSSEANI
jgi:hypothetical protein